MVLITDTYSKSLIGSIQGPIIRPSRLRLCDFLGSQYMSTPVIPVVSVVRGEVSVKTRCIHNKYLCLIERRI